MTEMDSAERTFGAQEGALYKEPWIVDGFMKTAKKAVGQHIASPSFILEDGRIVQFVDGREGKKSREKIKDFLTGRHWYLFTIKTPFSGGFKYETFSAYDDKDLPTVICHWEKEVLEEDRKALLAMHSIPERTTDEQILYLMRTIAQIDPTKRVNGEGTLLGRIRRN
ncbi:hypothetical protein M1349_00490 [Patescibacteria group bacterium]|nr:hypothetical protein [Patescibacteria group bacterium]